jgi:predicted nuclease of predicted toxin-antitoxin system
VRFLADESVDVAVINALRRNRHDVLAIVEPCPGATDQDVANLAQSENRVLLTEDRDFGRMVYAQLQTVGGVLYLRYPSVVRPAFAQQVVEFVKGQDEALMGTFVVLQPGRARISRLPEA